MSAIASPPRLSLARRGSSLFRAGVCGLVGFAVFFALLDIVGVMSGLSENALPRSVAIIQRTLQLPMDASFVVAVAQSLWATLIGLLWAALLAVPTGIVLGTSAPVYKAVSALVEIMRPVPSVALIPPALLILGSGSEMKVFLIAYSTFWIILFNTIYGIRDVDPLTRDAAAVFGTSRIKSMVRVSLPSAAPFIFTGIQISATVGFLVTIGAEMIAGGSNGIGQWLITHLNAVTERDSVFAGAFGSGLVGLTITGLLVLLSRLLFPWSVANRRSSE